ncbi:hypothetical protein CsSME_00000963 [Camellia sinensis var. sinensis]
MIFALVYCTAGISGGHINPAVTFGLLLARKLSLTRAVFYIVMQCLGAICGAAVVKGFEGTTRYELLGGGANSVNHGYTKGDGLGAEIVGTFVLVYTVFSATDAKRSARDSHVPVSTNTSSIYTKFDYKIINNSFMGNETYKFGESRIIKIFTKFLSVIFFTLAMFVWVDMRLGLD